MNEVGLVGKVTIVSKKDENLKYTHNYLHIYLKIELVLKYLLSAFGPSK